LADLKGRPHRDGRAMLALLQQPFIDVATHYGGGVAVIMQSILFGVLKLWSSSMTPFPAA
jgi:hypothetical protein